MRHRKKSKPREEKIAESTARKEIRNSAKVAN